MMRLLGTLLTLWLMPGLLRELSADGFAKRLAEIPSAIEAAGR